MRCRCTKSPSPDWCLRRGRLPDRAQMVQFIHQEAKEKAAEIKLRADEEFNIEKLKMVEAEKMKIRAEYERKEKQVEVQKRM